CSAIRWQSLITTERIARSGSPRSELLSPQETAPGRRSWPGSTQMSIGSSGQPPRCPFERSSLTWRTAADYPRAWLLRGAPALLHDLGGHCSTPGGPAAPPGVLVAASLATRQRQRRPGVAVNRRFQ